MKEQYIAQVKRKLHVSRFQREEVIRDLQEVFSSALEHGETEQEVIARLGPPDRFAENVEEQVGRAKSCRMARKRAAILGACLTAAVCAGLFLSIQLCRTPGNVIGQADAMTSMRTASSRPFDPSWLLLIIGAAFLMAAGILILRYLREKGAN